MSLLRPGNFEWDIVRYEERTWMKIILSNITIIILNLDIIKQSFLNYTVKIVIKFVSYKLIST